MPAAVCIELIGLLGINAFFLPKIFFIVFTIFSLGLRPAEGFLSWATWNRKD